MTSSLYALAKCIASRIKASSCYSAMALRRHLMETFSALLAICAGNSPVPGEFPTQRPVTRSFDVFFDLGPNKRLSKHSKRWWFEAQSSSLWRHRNGYSAMALRRHYMETFPWYRPFVRGVHRSPVNFPHTGQWRGALMCSVICAWTDGSDEIVSANYRPLGYLRRHCAQYDVIVVGSHCRSWTFGGNIPSCRQKMRCLVEDGIVWVHINRS